MENTEHPFFRSLPEAEKAKIYETAQDLVHHLGCWAPDYPLIRTNRIPPVAVLVAGVLPRLPIHQALLVGKLILLIFAIDDIADERLCSLDEFRQKSRVWDEILRSGQTAPEQEQDDLTGMFLEIRREFSQCPLFPALNELLASRLQSLCATVAREYEYGLAFGKEGEQGLPNLEEYLQVGIHSVGAPFWSTSILILLSEPSILQQLEKINETILQTGAAMRLFNDLRSYEKEIQESNINALTILQNQIRKDNPGCLEKLAFDQARDAVRRLAVEYAEKGCDLTRQIQTETGQFEEMIRRTIAFHTYFYGSQSHQQDYHTISSSDSFSLINGT